MNETLILYIIIAGAVSAVLAFFMYGYRSTYRPVIKWALGILRMIALFGLLLLLINPKITSVEYSQLRPELNLLIDNSSSISYLEQQEEILNVVDILRSDTRLSDRFNINTYSFSQDIRRADSLDFTQGYTDISGALESVEQLNSEAGSVAVLLSDGNQTLGKDYSYMGNPGFPVYSMAFGDTIKRRDVYISRVNVNRYAYLQNQFPVEVTVNYQGEEAEAVRLTISRDGSRLHSQQLDFNADRKSYTTEVLLEADRLGVSRYLVEVEGMEGEKNLSNNSKPFAVEVIDERTDVAIVSGIVHPDIGMWKKAIEANQQRTATLLDPAEALDGLDEYELVILYQPDRSFESLIRAMESAKVGVLLVSGLSTDWNFLGRVQQRFQKEYTAQQEDVSALLNPAFASFAIEDPGFDGFPPLVTSFGELYIPQTHQIALRQQISGYDSGNALLATMDEDGIRYGLLDGEGIWRWRARSYVDSGSFEDFDTFVAQLVQYLASGERKKRLDVRSESFYYTNDEALLTAQYFDENYVFDNRASLQCTLTEKGTGQQWVFPMILRNNYYGLELDGLPSGSYTYTVTVTDRNISSSGNFELVAFNIEEQFSNPDVTRLTRLTTNTGGELYFSDQSDLLISDLLDNEELLPVQRRDEKSVPLIDWIYLLIMIVIALSAEWFIRKYNGLI